MLFNLLRIHGNRRILPILEERLKENTLLVSSNQEDQEAQEDLKYCLWDIQNATEPAEEAHKHTTDEIAALRHLRKVGCCYTPWFIDYGTDKVEPGMDRHGMVGGYVYYIVMTKVPGKKITAAWLASLPKKKRDEIRQAFKEALM